MPARSPRKSGKVARSHIAKAFAAVNVDLGDRIRVERRFIVDGVMQRVADKGVFHGIQAMGSVEHILLESKGEVRLIPIPSISEIILERTEARRQGMQGFDPSFA